MEKTTWQFHGGIRTIGGTVIEIAYANHRIFFDFGRSFNPTQPVFDNILHERDVLDLKKMGIVPSVAGLFQDDGTNSDMNTMVLISHSHLDHTGLLPYLRRGIPVLLHQETYRLLSALDDMLDSPGQPLHYQPVADGTGVNFGPIKITLLEVDHDTPGASGFLIETPDVRFVYSGDLRLHGKNPEKTRSFARKARMFSPDVLFIEGTRVDEANNSRIFSETELTPLLSKSVAVQKGGVYFTYYPHHPERLEAFISTAINTRRTLLVQAPCAYIFETMGGDLSGCGIYGGGQEKWTPLLKRWVQARGLPVKGPSDIRNHESAYLINFEYECFRDWLDIDIQPGGLFIHSNGSPLGPYDPTWNNFRYWLDYLKVDLAFIGSTGHAAREDILELIKEIQPRVLMPIHSFQPERIGLTTVPRLLPRYRRVYTKQDLETARTPSESELKENLDNGV